MCEDNLQAGDRYQTHRDVVDREQTVQSMGNRVNVLPDKERQGNPQR